MEKSIESMQPDAMSEGFFDIHPEDVIEDARNEGLDISSIEDFRSQKDKYHLIEGLMSRYTQSYARYSAIGGATTGIGGVTTSITLGTLEVVNTAIQLYRLSQRLAVLNGFDPRYPSHQDKVQSIYLNTLGFKAAAQVAIKVILFKIRDSDNLQPVTGNLFSGVVLRIARKVGTKISSRGVSKMVPIVGGAIGAYASYSYASDTGQEIGDSFRHHYFKEWHNTEPPSND